MKRMLTHTQALYLLEEELEESKRNEINAILDDVKSHNYNIRQLKNLKCHIAGIIFSSDKVMNNLTGKQRQRISRYLQDVATLLVQGILIEKELGI